MTQKEDDPGPILEPGMYPSVRQCKYCYDDPKDPLAQWCGRPCVKLTQWCEYHLTVVYEPKR